ncbi:toxin-antitoxin system HicB family antitoxin [Burkholderia gladioli pv. gladioli]|uniref:toxin-antitoxin system HicB family antitoxin n=1 Tax=Burkholderia gladioli TaxID=28095 RepID=UPI00163F14F7|nr:toxin-antitoxin system HicB family antitoxin [Burkholderia gladioli]MDJ1160465.1 toxin-antitoxin system HicB family antitoxin [Burkholderia gladioli pv. gladioli]
MTTARKTPRTRRRSATLRMEPVLHDAVMAVARHHQQSLNELLVEVLSDHPEVRWWVAFNEAAPGTQPHQAQRLAQLHVDIDRILGSVR